MNTSPIPEDKIAADTEGLHAELAHARAEFDRLSTEYEGILADPDVIQEDRDSAGTMVEVARGRVEDIERALEQIEAGTYGKCAKCGKNIPAERLEALPDAVTCVDCG